jgi:hypothetical protein
MHAVSPPPFLAPHPGDIAPTPPTTRPRPASGSLPLRPAVDPQSVATSVQPTVVQSASFPIVSVGPAEPTWPDVVPPQHKTSELNDPPGRFPPFDVPITVGGLPTPLKHDLGGIFPEWVNVDNAFETVTLEGVCTGDGSFEPSPHVAADDLPISHYTHDFCFKVKPDPTADNRFTNLLGVNDDGSQQGLIEVEWECGLAADNDGNVCASVNKAGMSAGFFSAGHQRREPIWNWPTVGDWVHVVGRWIWDRGHTPATEIHPPRLVAIRRHLPELLQAPVGGQPTTVLATRVDIFASGDGNAFRNNRGLVPYAVPVNMAESNYEIAVTHLLDAPAAEAKLVSLSTEQPGDSFGASLSVGPLASDPKTGVIIIPWHDANVASDAVLARTIWLYWDTVPSFTEAQRPRVFNVFLDSIHVYNSQDTWPSDGEYRVFVEAGGKWWFVNEMPDVSDILDDGLGDTGDADPPDGQPWGIARQAQVCVLPGDTFRVHAGGWEADGADTIFGHLIDPDHPHDNDLIKLINETLFSENVFTSGSEDDPIGEVNTTHAAPAYGTDKPYWLDSSQGNVQKSNVWGEQDTDPNDSYALKYSITELPWAPALTVPSEVSFGTVPIGEVDTNTLKIENTGTADLTIAITAPPAGVGFSWHAVNITLAVGATQDLKIDFAPHAAQSYKQTLTIQSNTPGSSTAVTIQGTGTRATHPR